MSVSLSSVYQQTESLREIQQNFESALSNESTLQPSLSKITEQSCQLSMAESYRLVVVLSKYLNNNTSIMKKYAALLMLKKLVLTALHHFYIFVSVRALMWVFETVRFERRKGEYQRVRMYVRQLVAKGNGDQVVQERACYKLFKLVDEFLPWTAQNIPIHINAQFQFPSTFARTYSQLPTKPPIPQPYQTFTPTQSTTFTQNFLKNKPTSKHLIKQLCEFVSLQVRTLIDQQKYKSQLLREIVHTGDSHCVRAIVSEICGIVEDCGKLFWGLKVVEGLVLVGEVEFVALVGMYVVPRLLGYLLPLDFVRGKKLPKVPLSCTLSQQKCIIDLICIWQKISQKLSLSTQFYKQTLLCLQSSQKQILNVQQKHMSQFLTKVIEMEKVNDCKRPHLEYGQIQGQLIRVLRMMEDRDGMAEEGRVTGYWEGRNSVINQLNSFQDSRISEKKKMDQSGSYAAIFGAPLTQNITSIKDIKTPNKPIPSIQLQNSQQQQFMTFKQVQDISNQQIPLNSPLQSSPFKSPLQSPLQSPLKQPLKLSKANISQSSFMAFQQSNISKYSQYSVKRSKEGENKEKSGNSGGLLKREFMENSGSSYNRNGSRNGNGNGNANQSKSQSVVYFDRRQDFHSSNSHQNPSNTSQTTQKFQQSSAKSIKYPQQNQSTSTYKFDSSNINKSSASSSQIQNFGKEDLNFPETVPKPNFGFKLQAYEREAYMGDIKGRNQRMGGSFSSGRRDNTLSKILEEHQIQKKGNLMDSFSSEIKDLSGGKHRMIQSIKFSQVSEILQKQANPNPKKPLNFTPSPQYYPSPKQPQVPNPIKLHKSPPPVPVPAPPSQFPHLPLQSSPPVPIPTSLKKSTSDRVIGSSQNLVRFQEVSSVNKSKVPVVGHSGTSKEISGVGKKKHVILDQFVNDRLLDLEKELGMAMEERNKKEQQLKQKEAEYKILKSKSIPYMGRKVQTLKKQDQILQTLQSQKTSQQHSTKPSNYLKPLSNRNKITDFFLQNNARGKYQPLSPLSLQPYDRNFVKQILGSRCLLLSNQWMELGYNYSIMRNQVSFYLTFFGSFQGILVGVDQGSLILERGVEMELHNQPAGQQLKIKRKVKGVRPPKKSQNFNSVSNPDPNPNLYQYPKIHIKILDHLPPTNPTNPTTPNSPQPTPNLTFTTVIPCSILNLAHPIQIKNSTIEHLRSKKVLKSDPLPVSQEFMRNYKEKIQKYFPMNMGITGDWVLLGFSFPLHIFQGFQDQFFKIRVNKGKTVEFELFNDPKSYLAEALTCIFCSKQK